MKSIFIVVCIVVSSRAASFFSTGSTQTIINSANQMFINGHEINIQTEPEPKLTIDGNQVELSSAGSINNETDYTLYKDFSVLPGLSVKLYKDGGYTVYYEKDGVVSKFGSLSKEEREEMNKQIQKTFDNVNEHIKQVQQNVGNIMQSIGNIFSGWSHFG